MKIKSLLYCTKAKPRLLDMKGEYYLENQKELDNCNPNDLMNILNGKIVCECEVETEEIKLIERVESNLIDDEPTLNYETDLLLESMLCKKSCLTPHQLEDYLKLYECEPNEKVGYALHISNIKVFDKPRKLMALTKINWKDNIDSCILKKHYCNYGRSPRTNKWIGCDKARIKLAPQNMMWCLDENGNKVILISIRPEWLCLILNGEKDIEVRRKVLKGMVE